MKKINAKKTFQAFESFGKPGIEVNRVDDLSFRTKPGNFADQRRAVNDFLFPFHRSQHISFWSLERRIRANFDPKMTDTLVLMAPV